MSVVGGMPVGRDGRVHGVFSHNPSTGRLSMSDPNLQTIPAGRGDATYAKWVKEIFVAPKGHVFWARDFSGIEAVLVGYFAGSARYIRAAKLGVHAFFASHLVGEPADWSWDEAKLKAHFKEIKSHFPVMYDTAKRCVHGSNYKMTPMKMHFEYPETFPTVKDAMRTQGMYYDLFPEIPDWHRKLCVGVDKSKRRHTDETVEAVDPWTLGVCNVSNPFGWLHRFYNVLDWERIDGKWEWSYGEDAKRLIAFLPQSTGAGIIKRSAVQLWNHYPWVGRSMRLLIHDEIFGECREENLETCLTISKQVMEAPWDQLPLDPTWGLGDRLSIGTEAKVGRTWGEMH